MAGDNDDFFPDHGIRADTSDEYSADFQLPLPPLNREDAAFLRAVEARAASSSLIAAYNAEASERGMQRGLAPIYQGYLLRMSDGVSADELVSGSDISKGKHDKRRNEKL
ncbi:hypothetical protein SLS58_010226 [Diplodia intermedia]|uniref:Uncharacterized protein n=1 Tax=Diplodia intermedia TaxID=856260 RepID=A0ABR3T840_9PEZI